MPGGNIMTRRILEVLVMLVVQKFTVTIPLPTVTIAPLILSSHTCEAFYGFVRFAVVSTRLGKPEMGASGEGRN